MRMEDLMKVLGVWRVVREAQERGHTKWARSRGGCGIRPISGRWRTKAVRVQCQYGVLEIEKGVNAHRYAPVHGPFVISTDEEQGDRRNEGDGSDHNHVPPFESPQRRHIIAAVNNQIDVDGHREGPEHICDRKPRERCKLSSTSHTEIKLKHTATHI